MCIRDSTGTILTGLFSTSEGLFYGAGWSVLGAQVCGALVVGAWAAGMGFIIFKGLDKIHGLRVCKRVEEEGLDIYEHGAVSYTHLDVYKRQVEGIVKMIKDKGLEDRTEYITFSQHATKEFIRLAPKGTPVYYLSLIHI